MVIKTYEHPVIPYLRLGVFSYILSRCSKYHKPQQVDWMSWIWQANLSPPQHTPPRNSRPYDEGLLTILVSLTKAGFFFWILRVVGWPGHTSQNFRPPPEVFIGSKWGSINLKVAFICMVSKIFRTSWNHTTQPPVSTKKNGWFN